MNGIEDNLNHLNSMIEVTKSHLPFNDQPELAKYSNRADILYTQKDISVALGDIPISKVRKALDEVEKENGYEFLRDGRSWYNLTQEEAIEVVKKFNIYPIAEMRQKHAYDVPCIVVTSGKGGVGKTTTSITLATESALSVVHAKRVLLIDGDPQGSIRHFMMDSDLPLKAENSVSAIFNKFAHLSREERLSQPIQKQIRDQLMEDVIFESHIDNLKFTPALMSDMEILIMLSKVLGQKDKTFDDAGTLYKDLVITPLKEDFDIIYIDSSPACDPLTYNLYYASNFMIIPTTGRTQDFKANRDYLRLSKLIIKDLLPDDFKGFNEIRTLITKHLKNNESVLRNAGKIAAHNATFTQTIDENKIYEMASNENLPIQLLDTKVKSHKTAVNAVKLLHIQVMQMIEPYLFPNKTNSTESTEK